MAFWPRLSSSRSQVKDRGEMPLVQDLKVILDGQKAEVQLLQHNDISKAVDSARRAFREGLLAKYFASADTRPFREARSNAHYYLMFDDGVHKGRMLTVNRGSALMRYASPRESEVLDRWHKFLSDLIDKFEGHELTKRKKEVHIKASAMAKDAFGEKVEDMYEVQILATAPEAQGQGYGSARSVREMLMATTYGCSQAMHTNFMSRSDSQLFGLTSSERIIRGGKADQYLRFDTTLKMHRPAEGGSERV